MSKEKKEKMVYMSFRAPESLKAWVVQRAEEENIPYTTMIRVLLDRMKFEEEIINQLNSKKKKVK